MSLDVSCALKPVADRRPALLDAIRHEFRSWPPMALTGAQARRLWSLDDGTCAQLLQLLEDEGFLRRRLDGRYVLASRAAHLRPA